MFTFMYSLCSLFILVVFGIMVFNIIRVCKTKKIANKDTAIKNAKTIIENLETRKSDLTPQDLKKLENLKNLVSEKEKKPSDSIDEALKKLEKL